MYEYTVYNKYFTSLTLEQGQCSAVIATLGLKNVFCPRCQRCYLHRMLICMYIYITRGQFWPSGIVIAHVCVSVIFILFYFFFWGGGGGSTLNLRVNCTGLIRAIVLFHNDFPLGGEMPEHRKLAQKLYYNMTVWHFGPCVTFWPCLCEISARLVWHFGPLVRNEGKRVSPYPHIKHWRRL